MLIIGHGCQCHYRTLLPPLVHAHYWSGRSVPLSYTSPPISACSLLVGEVGAIIVHFSPQQCMLIIGRGGRCHYHTLLPPAVHAHYWSWMSVPLSYTSPPSSACSLLVGDVSAIIVHFSPQQCMLIIGRGGRCHYRTLLPPAVHAHYWSGRSVPLSYTSPPSSACSLLVREVSAIIIHFSPQQCMLIIGQGGRCHYRTLLSPEVHAHYWSGRSVPLSYTSPPSSACSLLVREVGAIIVHFSPLLCTHPNV